MRYSDNCEASQNPLNNMWKIRSDFWLKKGLNIVDYRFLDFPDFCNFPGTFLVKFLGKPVAELLPLVFPGNLPFSV